MASVLDDFDFYDCVVEGIRQVGQSVQVSLITDKDVAVVLQFDGVEYLEVLRIGEIADWTCGLPASALNAVQGKRMRLGYDVEADFEGLTFLCGDNYPFFTVIFLQCRVIS